MILLAAFIVPVKGAVWEQSRFEDFRGGNAEDGGANLYVTADGTVRSTYTFDYNQDGANDILFVQGHDCNDAPPTFIYMNSSGGLRTKNVCKLCNEGSQSGLIAGLNKDGRMDVVLCGSDNGMNGVALNAILYYGTDWGFHPISSQRLPTLFSRSVAAADLNGDGYPDLVFAQAMRIAAEKSTAAQYGLIVYWNSPNGFDAGRKLELPISSCSCVRIADLNEDGYPDVVARSSCKNGNQLTIFWGGKDGIHPNRQHIQLLEGPERYGQFVLDDVNHDDHLDLIAANSKEKGDSAVVYGDGRGNFGGKPSARLSTLGASACAVDDLNCDGFKDIVFANSIGGNSVIYGGSPNGYSENARCLLPTCNATGCAVGDFDGDGFKDVVFANRKNAMTYDVDSFVYFGGKNGFDPGRRLCLPTHGATDVQAADVNGDGRQDVIFFNAKDGTSSCEFSKIYWNDGRGHFDDQRARAFETWSPFSHVAADLNRDGHVDIVFPQSYEENPDLNRGSVIYWGDKTGWPDGKKTFLKTSGAAGVVAADLNRDGYLDLVFSEVTSWLADGDPKVARIYWGGKDGFSENRQTLLPVYDGRLPTLGDYNQDGWLDLVFSNVSGPVQIYWGSPEGYSPEKRTELPPMNGSIAVNSADLNNDGWLDLVVSRYFDDQQREGTYSCIYWNGPKGFSAKNCTLLPTTGADQTAIADFNKDGFLDIFFSNYATGGRDRTWSSFLYWGSRSGFSPTCRQDFVIDSGSGGLALDFNKDGWLDLAVASHKKPNGDHRADSIVFYNGPKGFSEYQKTLLRTHGAHEITAMDPGNIYNRKYELGFASSIFDAGKQVAIRTVRWNAQCRLGSSLKFQVRTANSREAIVTAEWSGVNGKTGLLAESGIIVRAVRKGRFLQYRAVFTSKDGSNYPVLDKVAVEYE